MKPAMKRDFLIALMNNKRDFKIAQERHWYRIPVKTKQVPKSVIDKSLQHIRWESLDEDITVPGVVAGHFQLPYHESERLEEVVS
jgi:hypothetical protein